jgi:hypothetical protein
MSEESSPGSPRMSGKKKWTIGGALTGAASIATILTLLITAGQSSSSSQGQQGNGQSQGDSPATATYPVNIQTNFLNACEENGTQAACQCSLSWFEQHVSLQQFEQDDAEADQGITPPDLTLAEEACG